MMSSSLTSNESIPSFAAVAKAISPRRDAPSASAATPPTSTSTGPPVARALCRVGQDAGSTPITEIASSTPASAFATPEINPPPPTATSTVSTSGACSAISSPRVPWPQTVGNES